MYYVYILKSYKDGKFYVGYSSDLRLRLKEHTDGIVKSTKNRRPINLEYYEAYKTKQLAQERERKLKKFGSSYAGLIKRITRD